MQHEIPCVWRFVAQSTAETQVDERESSGRAYARSTRSLPAIQFCGLLPKNSNRGVNKCDEVGVAIGQDGVTAVSFPWLLPYLP